MYSCHLFLISSASVRSLLFLLWALFLFISAWVIMSKKGQSEWVKVLCPDKQLHSDYLSDGSLFFPEMRICLAMGNPWSRQEPLSCFCFSPVSISHFHLCPLLSCSSAKTHTCPSVGTFSRTSFTQKLHRIQERLRWAPKSLQMVIAAMKLKDTPWKESYDQPR